MNKAKQSEAEKTKEGKIDGLKTDKLISFFFLFIYCTVQYPCHLSAET